MSIPVVEVFGPTIQGEGPVAGHRTVFVRTGGCDYRCTWCDSLHAVLPAHRASWQKMGWDEVWDAIRAKSPDPILVTLSGGNPAMHADLGAVISFGKEHSYTFAVETQGSVAAKWFRDCDYVILSPKPPSSGQKWNARTEDLLRKCIDAAGGIYRPHHPPVLKIPIFNRIDLEFAQMIGAMFPSLPLYLSVGNVNPPADSAAPDGLGWNRGEANVPRLLAAYDGLCQLVIESKMNAIVLPQLHVLVWGNKRGV